jgi:radical SAM protein with 4Fe4S-binding SPASM domain
VAQKVASLPAAVEVSLYSMDQEVFERLTQAPGSFARTIAGIHALRRHGVELLLKVPITTPNAQGVDKVFAFAREIGAACRADTKIVHRKDGNPAPLRLRVPEQQLIPFYRGPFSGCSIPEEFADDPRREGPLCAAGVRYCNITATDDVLACNILPGVAGNIREKPFAEIWQQSPWLAKLRSIRRQDLRVCSTCSKFAYCGRCHAQALVEDGDLLGPSSWACQHALALEQAQEKAS